MLEAYLQEEWMSEKLYIPHNMVGSIFRWIIFYQTCKTLALTEQVRKRKKEKESNIS